MHEGYADLHVHTQFSDGTLTPEEVVDAAQMAGVTLLAVADHNILKGSEAIASLLLARGIGYIPAVELDCVHKNKFYHLLAYGADFHNAAFRGQVRDNRVKLDRMSDELIERMQKDYPQLSLVDYQAFCRNPRHGGWKGLDYLLDRGIVEEIHQGMAFYERYKVFYEDAGFPRLKKLIAQIHRAEGCAILAHPGERIPQADPSAFIALLKELLDCGMDGIECYYPTHSAFVRDTCLALCEERGLMITSGSDCHGSFGRAAVGEPYIPISKLKLGRLLTPIIKRHR